MWFLVNRRVCLGCRLGGSAWAGVGHRAAFPWLVLPGGLQGHVGHCQVLQSLPQKLAVTEKLLDVLVV